MSDSKSALVKKIGEGNKSLSVIVAEDKLAKFKKFSQGINLSMGYLLNQAIDRYLANNSTEIFNTPTGIPTTPIGNNTHPVTPKEDNIEELINTTIETYLSNKPLDDRFSICIDEVKDLIKTSIDSIEVEASIDAKLTPLVELLAELETYTKNQFKAVREELKAISDRAVTTDTIATPSHTQSTIDSNPKHHQPGLNEGVISYAEFFKMVELTPGGRNSKEAQRALDRASELGILGWKYRSSNFKFYRETTIDEQYRLLNDQLGCDFTNSLLSIVTLRIKTLSDTHACQYIGELSMGLSRANPWLEADFTQCLFTCCGDRVDDIKANFDEDEMREDMVTLVWEDLLMALGKNNLTIRNGEPILTYDDMLSLDRIWHSENGRFQDRSK